MPTEKVIAGHLDLSQAEVSKLMGELSINWKSASIDDIRVAYIRKLRGVAAGHQSSTGIDLMHERALNERVDRELKEINLAEKRGQIVAVAALETELGQMITAFRTDLLSLPDKIKSDLDALYAVDIDLDYLTDQINDALHQLARYDPERASAGAPPGSDDGAASAHEHDGLGEGTPAPVA